MEYLLKAAEILETKGWIRGYTCDPEKGFCAWGAIVEAVSPGAWGPDGHDYFLSSHPDSELAWRVRGRVENVIQQDLTKWNDTPGRTPEEVIAVLRNAANLA